MQESSEHETRDLSRAVSAGTVRWGQGPLSFELHSTDPDFVVRAATIFASWPPPSNARVARRWRVEQVSSPKTESPVWEAVTSNADSAAEVSFSRGPRAIVMQAIEFEAVAELLRCPEEILGVHGGLAARNGLRGERGVAVVGPCFAGKSTLSCALWHSGWAFLCDDVTLFDDEGRAYPAPRRASLRASSRDLVGETLWTRAENTPSCDRIESSLLFHPHETDGQYRSHHTQLAAIVFLARRNVESAPAELRRLSPAQGAIALLPYSNMVQRLAFPSALSRLAPIAERVPIYDLGRGPLPSMIAQLDALIDGPAA